MAIDEIVTVPLAVGVYVQLNGLLLVVFISVPLAKTLTVEIASYLDELTGLKVKVVFFVYRSGRRVG